MRVLKLAGVGILLMLVFLGALTLAAGSMALSIAHMALGMTPSGLVNFPPFWVPALIGLGLSLWKHRPGPVVWGVLGSIVVTYLFNVFIVFTKLHS